MPLAFGRGMMRLGPLVAALVFYTAACSTTPPVNPGDADGSPEASLEGDGGPGASVTPDDAKGYCDAQAAFLTACAPEAGPTCLTALAESCSAVAENLSVVAVKAVRGCVGNFVCGHDLFDTGGCVDKALETAPLTTAQEAALRDLCSTCGSPADRCLKHAELNGPHRFGAAVVFASDRALAAKAQECLAGAKDESFDLNCENSFYNCMSSLRFPAATRCK